MGHPVHNYLIAYVGLHFKQWAHSMDFYAWRSCWTGISNYWSSKK